VGRRFDPRSDFPHLTESASERRSRFCLLGADPRIFRPSFGRTTYTFLRPLRRRADHQGKINVLRRLIGKSGWLTASFFSASCLERADDYPIFVATTNDGQPHPKRLRDSAD